jgi:hypothetical protein
VAPAGDVPVVSPARSAGAGTLLQAADLLPGSRCVAGAPGTVVSVRLVLLPSNTTSNVKIMGYAKEIEELKETLT